VIVKDGTGNRVDDVRGVGKRRQVLEAKLLQADTDVQQRVTELLGVTVSRNGLAIPENVSWIARYGFSNSRSLNGGHDRFTHGAFLGHPVLPKNSIRQLYQPTGHTSNWVTTETTATKKPGIPRESGCFTVTHRPVAANKPGKPMFTITQHASIGDAIRRLGESR
jgi:hypothetical protein